MYDKCNTIEHMRVKSAMHLQEYLKLTQGLKIKVMRYIHVVVVLRIYAIFESFFVYTVPFMRL